MAHIPTHTIEDALAVFTSYFLNYAAIELDVPAGPAGAGEGA